MPAPGPSTEENEVTKELIAQARDWLKRGPVAGNGTEIMRGLVDALDGAPEPEVKL